jgi:hypothetical protein
MSRINNYEILDDPKAIWYVQMAFLTRSLSLITIFDGDEPRSRHCFEAEKTNF